MMENKQNPAASSKKRRRSPKKVAEYNSKRNTPIVNEFSSYWSRKTYGSYQYIGSNIYDYVKPEELESIVKDPITNNKVLRDISLVLYGANGTYTNTVDYMTALPTLDKVIISHGNSPQKKNRNKKLMVSTLNTIKDKEFIRDALFRGMIEGVAFYYFETTSKPTTVKKNLTDYDVDSIYEINELGMNAAIISLPTDYTRIVGRKNATYVLAFNLDYFDICPGETAENRLKKFPKEIRDAYKNRQLKHNSGNWVVLDSNHTITHKIRSKRDEIWGRPLVLAAIIDILYRDYFTDTKRNVLDEINNRIVYQTFPEGKDKGTSALNKNQQQDQHDKVRDAVVNKNNRGGISFFSVAAGTKIQSIDVANTDIFDEKFESDLDDKVALALGFAANALTGNGSGSYSTQETNLELVSAQVFQWIEQIESELNKCINAIIINDKKNPVECKYLRITHLNKKSMVGYAKDLYLQGCGSLSLWSASCGVPPETFYALLDEEIESGIYDKYKPHQTSFTLSGNDSAIDDKGGRPLTDNPAEKTIQGRSNGANNNPSPSDNK